MIFPNAGTGRRFRCSRIISRTICMRVFNSILEFFQVGNIGGLDGGGGFALLFAT